MVGKEEEAGLNTEMVQALISVLVPSAGKTCNDPQVTKYK